MQEARGGFNDKIIPKECSFDVREEDIILSRARGFISRACYVDEDYRSRIRARARAKNVALIVNCIGQARVREEKLLACACWRDNERLRFARR